MILEGKNETWLLFYGVSIGPEPDRTRFKTGTENGGFKGPITGRIDNTGSGFPVKNPVGTVKVDNVEKLLDFY